MFARFRNLFSKSKSEMNAEDDKPQPHSEAATVAVTVTDNANGLSEQNIAYVSSVDETKLEGLNLLKSLVETEQQQLSKTKVNGNSYETIENGSVSTITQEVDELLNTKLANGNEAENIIKNSEKFSQDNKNDPGVNSELEENQISLKSVTILKEMDNKIGIKDKDIYESSNETENKINENGSVPNNSHEAIEIIQEITHNTTPLTSSTNCNGNETCEINSDKVPQLNTNKTEDVTETELKSNDKVSFHVTQPLKTLQSNSTETDTLLKSETESDSVSDLLKKMRTEVMTLNYLTKETSPLPLDPDQTTDNVKTEPESENVEISKTSIIKSWIQENNVNFMPPTQYPLQPTDSATKLNTTHSSIVMEDLPSEVTTPSPTVDGSISGSSSNTSTMDSTATRLAGDPTKIVVNPIGDNGLACNAITGKLTDIAEVAESLDTVIRDIQENSQSVEVESNPSPRDKKMGTLRSTSSEDWHSRSTEDESFATASEGRTSSFMSCNKSSFDYSEEGDDSTVNFEMPDVNSPFNMSFDESEQSYRSASHDNNKTPTKLSENGDVTLGETEAPNDLADLENLHSESVTPTPADNVEYYVESIPIESETELEVAAIANAPPHKNVLTETTSLPISVTPEVSSCSNQFDKRSMLDDNATPPANGQYTINTNNNKPTNIAWRRSKYYENITKQTIKGFL